MIEKIIVLDFGSQVTQLIGRRLREINVYCEIYPYNKIPNLDDSVKGLILSGSPCSVRDSGAPFVNLDGIKGHIPILTGGTGFYIQAVLYDIDFTKNNADESYRAQLEEIATQKGVLYLHDMLKQVDEKSAEPIHPNNVKRIIRALEYHHLTGQKISEHNMEERQKKSPYDFSYFVLNDERSRLYHNIDLRVDQMMQNGLVEEVKQLKDMGLKRENVSMQGLGYKEILDYLDEKTDLDRAIYLIKRDTRHFAKRQLTWFRREKDVIMIEKPEFLYDNQAILDYMLSIINK